MKLSSEIMLATLLLAFLPPGSPGASMYNKTHTYDMRLRAGESYSVAWQGRAVAFASDPRDFDPRSGSQPPVAAPAAGTTTKADAFAGAAKADAEARFTANANGTGSHRLVGSADRDANIAAVSSAFSQLALRKFVGTPGTASFRWRGDWVIDSLQSGRETDPVFFSALDLDTGLILGDDLFDIEVNLGAGLASWQNGTVSVDAASGTLELIMDSPFLTSGRGRLFAQFANGVVIASDDSGVFDGLLPAVGSTANFSFPLGDADGFVNLDFNVGTPNTAGFDLTIGAIAEARVAEVVPEPAAFLLLGSGLAAVAWLSRRRRELR